MSAAEPGVREKREEHTDELARRAVRDCVEHTHHPAGIPDCLLEPHGVFGVAAHVMFGTLGIFRMTVFLVVGGDGEDKKEGESRTRDEAEKVGVGEGVDVHEREVICEPELVDEVGEEVGVASFTRVRTDRVREVTGRFYSSGMNDLRVLVGALTAAVVAMLG